MERQFTAKIVLDASLHTPSSYTPSSFMVKAKSHSFEGLGWKAVEELASGESETIVFKSLNGLQRWRQGRNAGGTKTVRMPTASDATKIFTDHTFQIGLKCDYTL